MGFIFTIVCIRFASLLDYCIIKRKGNKAKSSNGGSHFEKENSKSGKYNEAMVVFTLAVMGAIKLRKCSI